MSYKKIVKIFPSTIKGEVKIPASKSAMQRACALALLNHGKTIIKNPGISNDDNAALSVIEVLGANVQKGNSLIEIESNGINPKFNEIDCGESGLSLRMFTPICAISDKQITIKGSGSLGKRPTPILSDLFNNLEIDFTHNNHSIPFTIKGPLKPKNITIDGSQSSQYLTGVLMAYSYAANQQVTINVLNLNSKPYIDLTLDIMKHFGRNNITNENYNKFIINKIDKINGLVEYDVEADWSSASYWLAAMSIWPNIKVMQLDAFSKQADKKMLEAIQQAGVYLSIRPNEIVNNGTATQSILEFDATHCPDLYPALAAMCIYLPNKSVILGVNRLINKESNRAEAIKAEFSKFGAEIEVFDDKMVITPIVQEIDNEIICDAHNDHRIVMALSIAAANRKHGTTVINGAEAINKSYPQFFEHFSQMNGKYEILTN